jgi:hypothetical protein
MRRLRQKVAKAPILVGLWPAEDAILKDEAMRAKLGADYFVSSLREGVIACLEAAAREGGAVAPRKATEDTGDKTDGTVERVPLPA